MMNSPSKVVNPNQVVERCSKGQFVVLGEVDDYHNPVSVVCRGCNGVFERSVSELLVNSDCPECAMHRHRELEKKFNQ